jgi:uncharacterized protein YoxC
VLAIDLNYYTITCCIILIAVMIVALTTVVLVVIVWQLGKIKDEIKRVKGEGKVCL